MRLMVLATLAMLPGMVGFLWFASYAAPEAHRAAARTETGEHRANDQQGSRAEEKDVSRRFFIMMACMVVSQILFGIVLVGFLLEDERVRAILRRIVGIMKS